MFVFNENEWYFLVIIVYYHTVPIILCTFSMPYFFTKQDEINGSEILKIPSRSKEHGGNCPKINLAHACNKQVKRFDNFKQKNWFEKKMTSLLFRHLTSNEVRLKLGQMSSPSFKRFFLQPLVSTASSESMFSR